MIVEGTALRRRSGVAPPTQFWRVGTSLGTGLMPSTLGGWGLGLGAGAIPAPICLWSKKTRFAERRHEEPCASVHEDSGCLQPRIAKGDCHLLEGAVLDDHGQV
jgi:hypothetical protein